MTIIVVSASYRTKALWVAEGALIINYRKALRKEISKGLLQVVARNASKKRSGKRV